MGMKKKKMKESARSPPFSYFYQMTLPHYQRMNGHALCSTIILWEVLTDI